MRPKKLSLVFIGLSLSSSWGNGHATNYRALLRALHARGHDLTFLERDQPWYAANRDLPQPDFCRLAFYRDLRELKREHARVIAQADAVVLGSYLADGPEVARIVLETASGLVGFYDIDTPITLAKLASQDAEYLTAELVPCFDFYLSFTGGPLLKRLEAEYAARLATAFYCLVDSDFYYPVRETHRWDLGYLGTFASDRQASLERLLLEPARRLPSQRFVVAGSLYPDDIDWPANVERITHLPPGEHPHFFGRLRFTLNLTRAAMLDAGWSPSVRLFEAAACGCPIITDRWPGLEDILPPDRALLTAERSEDVVTILNQVPVNRAQAMAQNARRIVLTKHTGPKRADAFEEVLATAGIAVRSRNSGVAKHALVTPN
ncbi:CgeB family protein [Aquibaculum sediminis]|uniref:CgeB family protein n=1 Tax=Aquibaculum sediminis TaxID=3231907 RepID=UPI0034568920